MTLEQAVKKQATKREILMMILCFWYLWIIDIVLTWIAFDICGGMEFNPILKPLGLGGTIALKTVVGAAMSWYSIKKRIFNLPLICLIMAMGVVAWNLKSIFWGN